jgi:hypothetical protein
MPPGSSSIESEMSVWVLLALFGLIKLPLAALMLWLPFRDDASMRVEQASGSADEDGGSRTLPAGPRRPRRPWPAPRRPSGHASGVHVRTPRVRSRREDRGCTPPPRAPQPARAPARDHRAAR